MNHLPKIGDVVKVTSGPAFVPGSRRNARGKVEEVTSIRPGHAEVMVRVQSGGLWGFMAEDLTIVKAKEADNAR